MSESDTHDSNCLSEQFELNECSICLCEISNEEEYTLPCDHKFHKECIDEWVKTSHILSPHEEDDETFEIQWQCPICRFIMSDKQEKSQVFISFSIVKFKRKRNFIKIFTLLDIIMSIISLYISGNGFYILLIFISYYGFNGANNFYIHHLRLYGIFCIFPLVFKSFLFIQEFDNIYVSKIKLTMSLFLSPFFSFISIVIQLYLINCIHYLLEQIVRYEYQIRQYIE